jgi:hypothetical protein
MDNMWNGDPIVNLSLEHVVSLDYLDDDDSVEKIEVIDPRSYDSIEKHFIKVFSNLEDLKGSIIGEKIKFSKSDCNIILKCDINNSMDFCYSILNKHIPATQKVYFVDESLDSTDSFENLMERNNANNLPDDVAKIVEFIHFLSGLKIPQEFVAGFLILMIKYKYNT